MVKRHIHTDKELFNLIAEGDEYAFKELFHRFVPLLQPVVADILRSDAAAKDIIQEVFLRVWLSRDQLPSIEVPRSWLFRLVYYQSFSLLRKINVRERAKQHLADPENTHADNPAEAIFALEETAKLIKEAIEQLTPQSHKIFLLSREQGLKIPEIAHQLGLSVQTVKNTLHRALKSIREYLETRGIHLPLFILSVLLF